MLGKSSFSYTHYRSVAFKDTDMAGVVHFTQLLAYIEEAEHAAMLSVGVAPISGNGGFPKVHVDCDYRRPVRFGDRVEIRLGIVSISDSTVRWRFEMVLAEERIACEGSIVTVFVNCQGEAEALCEDTRMKLGGSAGEELLTE